MPTIDLQRLDHRDDAVATDVHRVLIAAYGVEAELLQCDDFVPLRRTVEAIRASRSLFHGAFVDGELAGVCETEHVGDAPTNVVSLAVHPRFLRRGIGRALMARAMEPSARVTVSTGAANAPAVALYDALGFVEDRTWTTADGIAMKTFLWVRRVPRDG